MMRRCCRPHPASTRKARSWRSPSATPDGSRQGTQAVAEQLAPPHTTVITGASGWLGRALVYLFVCESGPRRLKLLAHATAEAHMLEALGEVDVVIGDIARPDTARRLLHQVSADCDVIHTAGIIHPRPPRGSSETNPTAPR